MVRNFIPTCKLVPAATDRHKNPLRRAYRLSTRTKLNREGPLAVSTVLPFSSGYLADLLEQAEMSDSDDDDLPSVRKIIAGSRQRQVIDLTLDNNDGTERDNDNIKVSWLRITQTARRNVRLPPFLIDRIQLADLLPSHPTILVAKVTRTHRR
jgi:hypothetical protein